jgi:hypothetical protein
MTTVLFKLRALDGLPIPNTAFKIEPGYPDSVINPLAPLPATVVFTTDANGDASVNLVPALTPYFISRSLPASGSVIAYKFFVPDSPLPVEATVLYVDVGTHLRLKNDESLQALIEAKVTALNALYQITAQVGESGSFIANFTGFDSAVTAQVYYQKFGNVVMLYFSLVSGVSNAGNFDTMSIPAALRPATRIGSGVVRVVDNGVNKLGVFRVHPSGLFNIYPSEALGNFTGSGSKQLIEACASYLVV